MKKSQQEAMYKQIEKHGRDLLKIYPEAKEQDPVKLCKRLMRVERMARQWATDYCNGDYRPANDDEVSERSEEYIRNARRILGEGGPDIIGNLDPRGCFLKIDSEKMQGVDLFHDMGGNGIICPTFDGE